ncbi:MAG: inorganic phosphate transporter, partial [Phycisphaerales bacterium]|nr:inorganic phosphate transporter [Phycisphaerales bacterium]
MVVVSWLFRYSVPSKVDKLFRRLQLLSAAVYSLGHGGNDAQKTMGIIVMVLTAAGMVEYSKPRITATHEPNCPWVVAYQTDPDHPNQASMEVKRIPVVNDPLHPNKITGAPAQCLEGCWDEPDKASWINKLNIFGFEHHIAWWIILTCHAAIALGTMFGGWRIVKTMGMGITRLTPVGGCCAETAAAMTIWFATFAKVPMSTTHAITGSILGVGSTKSVRSVRWIWGQRIVMAWVLTIPCSAFIAAASYGVIQLMLMIMGD